jgi:hypothetical protein
MNGWAAKEAIPRPWPWDVIRWRARRSHLLDLQCGAKSAFPPATSDRRAIRSPNISPRLRPSQIRGANISALPISPFKADNKSPAEIPIATASPHYPPPPKSRLSIHQSCSDPATGRRPERRHRPERFSFSRLRRHGFSTNCWSRIASIAFQPATRLTSSQ